MVFHKFAMGLLGRGALGLILVTSFLWAKNDPPASARGQCGPILANAQVEASVRQAKTSAKWLHFEEALASTPLLSNSSIRIPSEFIEVSSHIDRKRLEAPDDHSALSRMFALERRLNQLKSTGPGRLYLSLLTKWASLLARQQSKEAAFLFFLSHLVETSRSTFNVTGSENLLMENGGMFTIGALEGLENFTIERIFSGLKLFPSLEDMLEFRYNTHRLEILEGQLWEMLSDALKRIQEHLKTKQPVTTRFRKALSTANLVADGDDIFIANHELPASELFEMAPPEHYRLRSRLGNTAFAFWPVDINALPKAAQEMADAIPVYLEASERPKIAALRLYDSVVEEILSDIKQLQQIAKENGL